MVSVLIRTPQNDRVWIPEQSRVATADVTERAIMIRNVRDWTYDETGPLTQEWGDVLVDPSTITRVWFLLEPFSAIEAVGHTFLSFEFENGTVLSFSVEARREAGEKYSALKGQFRAYELSYQWGLERDFVSRRLVYLDHPLRRYPLELSKEQAGALFRSLAEETNVLAEKPRFYNTLTANCTNVLATLVNAHYPDTLPYDIAWNLTGYADRYLMDQELIRVIDSKEATMAAYDLTPHTDAVRSFSRSSSTEFNTSLRALLPQ